MRARRPNRQGFTLLPSIALSVLACAMPLALGCASTNPDRVNPEVPPWFNRPSGAMHVFVHRQLTAESRKVGEDYERGKPEIDHRHQRVFCGSADKGLYALRAGDGSTIWRFETMGFVQSEPLYDPELDIVYFGSNDGALYAARGFDGKLVWRYATGAEVAKRPVRVGETLYVANAADHLFAIDRRTGRTKWTAHRTSALGMEVAGHSGPAVAFGRVYLAFSDGNVAAYEMTTGREVWTPVDLSVDAEQPVTGELARTLDVDTTPIPTTLDNGQKVVFVSNYAAGTYALDAETGGRAWTNADVSGVTDLVLFEEPAHPTAPDPSDETDAPGPLEPKRQILLASSATTGLWGLDPQTGRKLWRNKVPEGGITAPVPVAGAVLIGSTRYGMFLIAPTNGKPIDGFDLGTGFAQTPAVYGKRAYAVTNSGTFVGIDIALPRALPKSPKWPAP